MRSQKRERPTPEEVGPAVSVSTDMVPKNNLLSEDEIVKRLREKFLKMKLREFLSLTDTDIRFVLSSVDSMHQIQVMVEFIQQTKDKSA